MDNKQTPSLDELMEFPAEYTFRLIAAHHDDLVDWCAAAMVTVMGVPPLAITEQPSSGGRWRAVRLSAWVESADQVRAVYAELHLVQGVRMLL